MAFKMKHKKGAFPYKSSPMKRAGDYDLVTGQRLSKEEADALIEDEAMRAKKRGVEPEQVVTSTYQDAIDRAKTPEEKAAAEAKMAELRESEEGKALIAADEKHKKVLEGTYGEGGNPVDEKYSFSWPTADKKNREWRSEQELVEGWGGEDAIDRLEEEEPLRPE
tara:strand:+ start:278 stop:772 length:495 start_codon:yes stop_codon:yes gene_type:complete